MTRYAMPARQRLVSWYLRDYRESAGYDLAQLRHLAELAGHHRHVTIRLLPFASRLPPAGGTRTQPGSQYRRAPQARRRPLRPRAAPLPRPGRNRAVPRRGGRQPGGNRKFLAMTSLIRKTNDHHHIA